MAEPLRCITPHYYILKRDTTDESVNLQLEALQQDFIQRTQGNSSVLPESFNEPKICELLSHVQSGVIGHGQLRPGFIRSSCETSNIVIYLQRTDNPSKIPDLTKTLGFMSAKVRENNTLELELIATSIIYKGCGANILNTFLASAKNAGFDHCYLYSLLSPFPFYQHQGFTYLGSMKGNRQKDYLYIDLQTNTIKPSNLSSIRFDPPKPGTTIKNPMHHELMEFMAPNTPFENVQPSNLARLSNFRTNRKRDKNGRMYVLFTRKRGNKRVNKRVNEDNKKKQKKQNK